MIYTRDIVYNNTWIVVFRSEKCVWYARILTDPGSRGTGTWETTHLPCSKAYCAPSTSFTSFDLMLSVWRGPSINISIMPSLSETSNVMFSKKVPAWQLCGTCQITINMELSRLNLNKIKHQLLNTKHSKEQNQYITFKAFNSLLAIWNVLEKIFFFWWETIIQAAQTWPWPLRWKFEINVSIRINN